METTMTTEQRERTDPAYRRGLMLEHVADHIRDSQAYGDEPFDWSGLWGDGDETVEDLWVDLATADSA